VPIKRRSFCLPIYDDLSAAGDECVRCAIFSTMQVRKLVKTAMTNVDWAINDQPGHIYWHTVTRTHGDKSTAHCRVPCMHWTMSPYSI